MRKGDLKKQSQFAPAQIDAKSYSKGIYGNKPACGAEENKANQACPELSRMEPNAGLRLEIRSFPIFAEDIWRHLTYFQSGGVRCRPCPTLFCFSLGDRFNLLFTP